MDARRRAAVPGPADLRPTLAGAGRGAGPALARGGAAARRLGHSKIAPALLILVLALGCASLRWSLQKWFRREGTANLAFPEAVWEEYDCGSRTLPFFRIEKNELVPPRVRPGGEFSHRLVYVLCPARPTAVAVGRLHTRIRFKGEPIYRQTDTDYELLPGRWRVDTIVELPEDAEAGVYAYEIQFSSPSVRFEERRTFLVNGR